MGGGEQFSQFLFLCFRIISIGWLIGLSIAHKRENQLCLVVCIFIFGFRINPFPIYQSARD